MRTNKTTRGEFQSRGIRVIVYSSDNTMSESAQMPAQLNDPTPSGPRILGL